MINTTSESIKSRNVFIFKLFGFYVHLKFQAQLSCAQKMFDNMVSKIYLSELQLNKANSSDTEATFLGLHLSISNDIVSTKIYDKHDDFDFEIVNFPFLDGDVPRTTSYGVYISQLIRFARSSSYVTDFNTRN